MAVAALVPLAEYLSTSYKPDREYVGGQLIERNVGEFNHSFLQTIITMILRAQGVRAYVELRFQVGAGRFRVPDVMALPAGQKRDARYQRETPYIVIEILSPDDRFHDMIDRLRDYTDMKVPNVWVVDPANRSVMVQETSGSRTVTDRVQTHDGLISVDVADIFRQMDEDEAE